MTDTNSGIVKYIPGLILCVILGWLALQWDQSIHKWQKDYQESEKILKPYLNEGKPLLPFDEYVAKSEGKYKEKLSAFEHGDIKEKPKKPHLLQKIHYETIAATKVIPFKLRFGERMI